MLTHLTLGPAVRVVLTLSVLLRRIRERPDAGMESADKILWAAVVTLVVGSVGLIFKTKLEAFANSLTVDLGW